MLPSPMKLSSTTPPLLSAIAAFGLMAGSAQAALVLRTDFNTNAVNTTDTDTDGAGADTLDATGINWDTVDGINTPSTTLSFTGASDFLTASGDSATNSAYINPNTNIGTGGTWSTSLEFTLSASTEIDLTGFVIDWASTNNSGGPQTTNRNASWTLDIIGSSSGSLLGGGISKGSTAPKNYGDALAVWDTVDFASTATLTTSETYTISIAVENAGSSGFYARLEGFSMSGNINVIPEPSAALLGALGSLLLLRRRR